MKMISFKVPRTDAKIIQEIVERAMLAASRARLDVDRMTLTMDLTAVHANGCPLRLHELLTADNFNFTHDVFGIMRHVDRNTGELRDCFVPRYAVPERVA